MTRSYLLTFGTEAEALSVAANYAREPAHRTFAVRRDGDRYLACPLDDRGYDSQGSLVTTIVVVLNAGHRERQALDHWHSCLNDVYTNIGPCWRALEAATYDSRADAITWRDTTLTIAEINAMERRK